MPTIDNTQLDTLVASLKSAQAGLQVASDANDQAQSAAQAAVAQASATLQSKNTAHDALDASIDALVAFVTAAK